MYVILSKSNIFIQNSILFDVIPENDAGTTL